MTREHELRGYPRAANILREEAFSSLIDDATLSGFIELFAGHVDDCFAVIHSSVGDSYDNVAAFIEKLNAVDPTQFKWTVKRSNSEMNFMDLNIKKHGSFITTGAVETETYLKPNHRPQYLAFQSQHSLSCKLALCRGETTWHFINCRTEVAYRKSVLRLPSDLKGSWLPHELIAWRAVRRACTE